MRRLWLFLQIEMRDFSIRFDEAWNYAGRILETEALWSAGPEKDAKGNWMIHHPEEN